MVLRTGLIEEKGEGQLFGSYKQFPLRGLYALDDTHPCFTLPLTTTIGSTFDLRSFSLLDREGAWLLIRGREATRDKVAQAVIRSTGNRPDGEPYVRVTDEFRFGRNIHLLRIHIE